MADEQLLLLDLTGGGYFLRLVFSEGGCMAVISENRTAAFSAISMNSA